MSTPEHFELEHSVPPDPSVVDGEVATREWPLPPVKRWRPAPSESMLSQIWRALARGAS
ncbi:MAG: hypothetical protein KF871_10835 [Hydrogenophaga sp.]|uniref:hypothetical protein n=1 Tax=Hydrogenophaga sp. TaxID=1904254 RepID=UPI001E093B8D|nr:hypothetical protein [Hydrogenophaga sp.]MBX3610377.1 hypothetical protein [Hydrogenophaga sp.]